MNQHLVVLDEGGSHFSVSQSDDQRTLRGPGQASDGSSLKKQHGA